jgi:hypothetical protein
MDSENGPFPLSGRVYVSWGMVKFHRRLAAAPATASKLTERLDLTDGSFEAAEQW